MIQLSPLKYAQTLCTDEKTESYKQTVSPSGKCDVPPELSGCDIPLWIDLVDTIPFSESQISYLETGAVIPPHVF